MRPRARRAVERQEEGAAQHHQPCAEPGSLPGGQAREAEAAEAPGRPRLQGAGLSLQGDPAGLLMSTATAAAASPPARILPALQWLRALSRTSLRGDLVAGITLAAYLLPAALGDASLANLPPESGLYACLFSGLVFWLFCSSRQTTITVTSAISLLIGASLGPLAGGDPVRFRMLAACTAMLLGAIAFLAW